MSRKRAILIGVGAMTLIVLAFFFQESDTWAQSTPVGSTLSNPHPYGAKFSAGVFDMQITGVDLDAWPEIQAENQFNDPPAEGRRYVIWTISVENSRGAADASEHTDNHDFSAVVSGVVYEFFSLDHYCGIFPNRLDHDLFLGGRLEANICLSIPEDDPNITLRYEADHVDSNGDDIEVDVWFRGLSESGQSELPTYHPCDTNRNGKIDLAEAIEVVRLYFAGLAGQ